MTSIQYIYLLICFLHPGKYLKISRIFN